MAKRRATLVLVTVAGLVLASGAAGAQGITQPRQGHGGSAVKGAAGTERSIGDDGLEHCARPMAAMAVVEPQSEVLTALLRYRLQSPVGLIRLMIQQSNCFVVSSAAPACGT